MPEPAPSDRTFPEALNEAERRAMLERRRNNGIAPNTPLVGVALSGGGIRSATFCLGLFQAMARQRLIRRIDYLSTVSGGGYFGSFVGMAFSRDDGSADKVESELSDNNSWSVRWLRENGRFLSPNGAGDNWLSAAVALRNWVALHVVLLTFTFLILALAALIRADLWTSHPTSRPWDHLETLFWNHQVAGIWWSPWMILPVFPFVLWMLPTGSVFWLTQLLPFMGFCRHVAGIFSSRVSLMSNSEFAGRVQHGLTRLFMLGFIVTVVLLALAVVDSLGQTAYLYWSGHGFEFPSLWAMLTSAGFGLFGLGSKIALYVERLLGVRGFRIPSNLLALGLALTWSLLIVLGLSVTACGFAWQWGVVWSDDEQFLPMMGGWPLMLAVTVSFVASWFFSRAFGFVNLSSMQQTYAARLARAYLGATNNERRESANHSMTDLIPGDDVRLEDYAPHTHGGPLHLINVTVNETISGRTQIERRDRKGMAMAIGPCGLSVGIESHALWVAEDLSRTPFPRLQALFETRTRAIQPIPCPDGASCFHALCDTDRAETSASQRIEALALGRWTAVSGAAFTTGTGANTELGLSLLLGLANIRLGYWWDSGITAGKSGARQRRPNAREIISRMTSRILPVQSCLTNEFLARFHGPARRHWYLSDGGHFENTGCYELIRRRVPFIICSDAGQDPEYGFADLANLVRKARIDFNAEIQIVRHRTDLVTDDPGVRFPMPALEDLVHPNLLDVIGTPDDFAKVHDEGSAGDDSDGSRPKESHGRSRCHALLARIQYLDNDQFSWLLLVKPSLMGDESIDVLQYQRTRPLFPQEPTTDQFFDEAQWESYRKLGEHIGTELFTPPAGGTHDGPQWSPSQMVAPEIPSTPRVRIQMDVPGVRLTTEVPSTGEN